MAEINSNININADTRGAVEAIKELQRQISAFQISLARGNASAQKAARAMQQNLIDNIDATGKFNASLTSIKSTTESFTDALERNKLTMGEYFRFAGGASKTFGRSFKREFDVITQVAVERVKDLQTQYISLGRDANGALKAIKIRPLTLDMQDFGVQTQISAQRAQLFNKLIEQGSTNLLNWGKNTQWAGRQLMVGFTVPLTMMGTVAAKTFMEIEEQVIKLRRVYGDFATTVEDTDKMVSSLRTLASEFTKWGVSVEKTMSLAADAAATGKMGADLIDQVTQATRLAVLGQVEQQQALETTMSITNAFGIATEKLASKIDFLNAVENQSVTAIEDLTIAIPKAGPVIKQLGGDVEDLAFFLTAMKEGGINASEGANALKSGLASLINPTDKASEFLGKFGVNIERIVQANKGDVKGLVIDFAKALDTLDPLNRARSIEQLFGKFQFSRLSTLFQNVIRQGSQAERVLGLARASTEELAIVSERELRKIEESTTYRFQKATADLQAALAPVGEEFLKAVTPFIKMATDILKAFNQMSGGAKQFITNVTLFVGGVGPALIMTIGLVANGVAQLIKFFNGLRNLFSDVDGSTNDLASSTDYMTQAQIEAAAVASSLDQAHNKLVQTFGVEGAALEKLVEIYQRAIQAQNAFRGKAGIPETPVDVSTGYAKGVVSVPGPKGAGDIVPAMLSPGEAVIPAKMTEKYKPLIRGMINGNLPGYKNGGIIEDSYRIGPTSQFSKEQIENAIATMIRPPMYARGMGNPALREAEGIFIEIANEAAMTRADVYRKQEIAHMQDILETGAISSKFIAGNAGRGGFEHLDQSRLTVSETIYSKASEGKPGSEIYGYLKSPILPFDISELDPIISSVAAEKGGNAEQIRNRILELLNNTNNNILKSPVVGGYGEVDLKFNRAAMMASNAQVVLGDTLSSSTDDLLKYNARMAGIEGAMLKDLLSGTYVPAEGKTMFGPSNSPAFYEVAIPASAAGISNIDYAELSDTIRTIRPASGGFEDIQTSPELVKNVAAAMQAKGIPFNTGKFNDEAMIRLLELYQTFEPETIGMSSYRKGRTFAGAGKTPPQFFTLDGKSISVQDALALFELRDAPFPHPWETGKKTWQRIPGFAQGGLIGQGSVDTSGFSTMYGTTPGNFVTIGGKKYYAKQPIGNEAIQEVISSAITKDLGLSNIPTLQLFGQGIVGSEIIEGLIPSANPELSTWLMQQPDKIAAAKDLLNALTAYNINDVPINAAMGNTDVHANNVKYDPASKRFVNIDTGRNIVSGYKAKASSFLDKPLVLFDANQDSQGIKQRVKSAIESVLGLPLEGSEVAKIYQETGYGTDGTREINVSDATSRLLQMFGLDPTLDVTKPENKQLIKNSISNIKTNPYFADLIAQNPELGSILEKEFSNPNSSLVNNLVELLSRAAVINKGGLGELPKFADGVMSVPGPKGAGDIIPAMLSPGEAVIPAGMTKKYKPLIQGMIAGNLPGFQTGTDGGVRGRRGYAGSLSYIEDSGNVEAQQAVIDFTQMQENGEITFNMLRSIVEDIAKAVDRGADVSIFVETYKKAIQQMELVGSTSIKQFERIARYGITNFQELVQQYGSAGNVPLEAIRANASPMVQANTEIAIPNLLQNLRPEFAHLTEGVEMTVEEFKAKFKDLYNSMTKNQRKLIDEAATNNKKLLLTSGFGIDIQGKLNEQMANAGADAQAVLQDVINSGIESLKTSITVGGGNFEQLRPETEKFDKLFADTLATRIAQTNASVVVDTQQQVEELAAQGVSAVSIAEVAQIALAIAEQNPEMQNIAQVLRTAETTVTSIRPGGSERAPLTDRGPGGWNSEVLNAELVRLQEEAKKAVEKIVDSVLQGIKDGLGIASPSKVAREEVGEPVADGVVEGANSKVPDATEAGQNIANALIPPGMQEQAIAENAKIDELIASGMTKEQALQQVFPQGDGLTPEEQKQKSRAGAYKVARVTGLVASGLSMGASFVPGQLGEMAQKAVGPITAATTAMQMIPGPWGVAAGLTVGLVSAFIEVNKALDETRDKFAKLTQELGTGAKAMEAYATFAKKATASEIMNKRRTEANAGLSVKSGKTKFGATFLKSEEGDALFKSIEQGISELGRSTVIEKLGNQLTTAVISGVLTTDEAQSIAYAIGKKLNDFGVTIGVSAKVNNVLGPKGKNFEENPLQVSAQVTGNAAETFVNIGKEMDMIKSKGNIFDGFSLAELEGQQASALVDLVSVQQQMVDALDLEYSKRIDNFNAQNKFNKALQLSQELEQKRQNLLAANQKQLEESLGIDFEALGKEISGASQSMSDYIDSQITDLGQGAYSVINGVTGATQTFIDYASAYEYAATWNMDNYDPSKAVANVTPGTVKEVTAMVTTKFAGTEQEQQVADILSRLGGDTATDPFSVMMKIGLASGSIDVATLDRFTQLAFDDQGAVFDIVTKVSGILGTPAGNQLMQIAEMVPPGEDAARIRMQIMTSVEGELSDPIYAQQVLDTFSTLTAYASAYGDIINVNAILDFYSTNPDAMKAEIKDFKDLKKAEQRGDLSIKYISKFITDEEGFQALKGDSEYFNSLDPENRVLYVQTLRTVYETLGQPGSADEIQAWKQTNNLMGITDEEARQQMAADAARSATEAFNETLKTTGDNAKNTGDNIGGLANEFDLLSAKMDVLQKALSIISMKEEKINSKYDKRAEALQEIADLNQEIAQQQQNQLDIADALSRGDIAAAARAVQKYRSDEAALAVQKQQKALEDAREQELAAVSFDGNTRKELEARLRRLEMQLAKRDYREAVQYLETRGASALTGGGTGGTGGNGGNGNTGKQPKIKGNATVNSPTYNGVHTLRKDLPAPKAGYKWVNVKGVWTTELKNASIANAANQQAVSTASLFRDSTGLVPNTEKENKTKEQTDAVNTYNAAVEDTGIKAETASAKVQIIADRFDRTGNTASNLTSHISNVSSNVGSLGGTLVNSVTHFKDAANAAANVNSQMGGFGDSARSVVNALLDMRVAADNITATQKTQIMKDLGYANGGMIPSYFATGGKPLGSDTVPAMLTPGEFVIKRAAVQEFGVKNLKAINSGTYGGESVYNYSINVNVSTDANPDQIARAVAQNVKRTESYRLRGTRI